MPIRFVIHGEIASKANSRRLVFMRDRAGSGRRPAFIKSAKARAWMEAARHQIPRLPALLTGRVRLSAAIFYASERPDLDGSLLCDALQGRIIVNDRQIRELHLWHGVDRQNPRVVVEIEPIQGDMLVDAAAA